MYSKINNRCFRRLHRLRRSSSSSSTPLPSSTPLSSSLVVFIVTLVVFLRLHNPHNQECTSKSMIAVPAASIASVVLCLHRPVTLIDSTIFIVGRLHRPHRPRCLHRFHNPHRQKCTPKSMIVGPTTFIIFVVHRLHRLHYLHRWSSSSSPSFTLSSSSL